MPMQPLFAVVLAAVGLLAGADLAAAKVYERCELARELVHSHGVPCDELAVWVCLAQHESTYNTSAVGHVGEGGDHGLFQISDLYWCSHRGPGKACGVSCAQLLDDDIADDVACVRRIYREHQGLAGNGFSAWAVYPLYCKRPERAAKYLEGCFSTACKGKPQPFYGLPPPAITAPPPPRYRPRPQTTTTTTTPRTVARLASVYGLPPSPATPIPVVSRWTFPRFTTAWTAPPQPPQPRQHPQPPQPPQPRQPPQPPQPRQPPQPPQPRQPPQPQRPQRPAADPSNFWNWQFLSRRRWF